MKKDKFYLLFIICLCFVSKAYSQIKKEEIVTSTPITRLFYVGVNNSLSVYPSDAKVEILEGDGIISKIGTGKYNLTFSKTGQIKLQIKSKYLTTVYFIPVKNIPDPKILFCGSSNENINKLLLNNCDSLELNTERFHFEGMEFKILNYNVLIEKSSKTDAENKSILINFVNSGARFSLNLKNEIVKLDSNDKIIFYDIVLSSGQPNNSRKINASFSYIIH